MRFTSTCLAKSRLFTPPEPMSSHREKCYHFSCLSRSHPGKIPRLKFLPFHRSSIRKCVANELFVSNIPLLPLSHTHTQIHADTHEICMRNYKVRRIQFNSLNVCRGRTYRAEICIIFYCNVSEFCNNFALSFSRGEAVYHRLFPFLAKYTEMLARTTDFYLNISLGNGDTLGSSMKIYNEMCPTSLTLGII